MPGRVAGAREKDWHEAGGEKAKHLGRETSLSLPGWKRMWGEEGYWQSHHLEKAQKPQGNVRGPQPGGNKVSGKQMPSRVLSIALVMAG